MTKKELMQLLMSKGVNRCEIKLEGCKDYLFLTLAHKEKRWYYKTHPELLWEYSEVICACSHCHNLIEYNKELSKEVFRRLR